MRLARQFAAARLEDAEGWAVISGLPIGCDTAAHRATLEAGGRRVAVLAHGLKTIAPRQSAKLAQEIAEGGGCLVTEHVFGTKPRAAQFVKLDLIQARADPAFVAHRQR